MRCRGAYSDDPWQAVGALMARIRRRPPAGPSGEDRALALDRARAMCWYGLVVEVEPPWNRDQVEEMGAAELREVLAARPKLATASTVAELVEVAEGRRPASVFWEHHAEGAG